TDRQTGKAIEAYAIQGTTTSSPVVAVFTKKDKKKVDESQPTTSKGDEPAPTVEIPEYTKPIGTAGQEVPPTVEKPEYTEPIGTAGQEEPPTVTIPEYTEPIGTAGQEEAPTVEKPEYTEPIGTSGDQAAPTLSLPDYPVRVLKDKETGVEIIGGVSDLEGISHISSRRVLAQELFSKTYDAYDL
ncbi:SIALI-17 repeat-containing surface protein, partial [Streptococcus cristatus]|uniref:SIALI-17 repeat-containing surface protein n=1 Tax=Streptococcus cristatus TaxID=45634 RepID=UPI000B324481